MNSILLSDNLEIKSNLEILKERTFITLKFMFPSICFLVLGETIYLSTKLIMISAVLRDGLISKGDLYDECLERIYPEYLDVVFEGLFEKIKKYAETGHGLKDLNAGDLANNSNKISWPVSPRNQSDLRSKMINFEINFERKKQILPKDKIILSEMRIYIAKIWSERHVLDKKDAIKLCRNRFESNFDVILFEENWRYFEALVSSQKS